MRPLFCSVDSLNVPKGTSGALGTLSTCWEVFSKSKRKKIPLRQATNASCTVSIRIMFSSAHDAKTNASRVVNGLEICRMKSDAAADLQTTR